MYSHAVEGRISQQVRDEFLSLVVCARAGLIRLDPPSRLARIVRARARWGAAGAGLAVASIRHGSRIGLVDDFGPLTFAEMDRRANALAHGLRRNGLAAGDEVGIAVQNQRAFIDATFAAARVGARAVLLNTDLAPPRLRAAASREAIRLLYYDVELEQLVEGIEPPLGRLPAANSNPLEDQQPPPKPSTPGSVLFFTSGTTGVPKAIARGQPRSLAPAGPLLANVPLRAREATIVCPPLFHAFGFGSAQLTMALGSTLIVRRRFDPAAVLADLERHRATAIVLVPTMLRRIVEILEESTQKHDLSSLRAVIVGGAQLGESLATRAMDSLGEVVYNIYGSTEASCTTIATPRDLRAAPGCVGRPVHSVHVRIVDDDGRPVEAGATGRVVVGNRDGFDRWTDDRGHFDRAGRLFIDGRADEMVVSGGEKLSPTEVEELLRSHPEIADALATGVPDDEFGQRLRAFVVPRAGANLSEHELRAFVGRSLARFMVPRDVVFVDQLPKTVAGKVTTAELAADP